ncbi:hypothetical protein GPECTOR_32g531 [Gonium pectorale]|uniref:Uncharacterized protein n=1 Tax=Gonium pectorale TaxID=33097 RepID=A0A150GDM8_GONPE|nr:hypothetical protein GPECTOR_32g531 [Gonium pectorale]|eukprot:KXZ47918.1 hypothetical protein GPECTOR_32g531 [Gonium pectorale]
MAIDEASPSGGLASGGDRQGAPGSGGSAGAKPRLKLKVKAKGKIDMDLDLPGLDSEPDLSEPEPEPEPEQDDAEEDEDGEEEEAAAGGGGPWGPGRPVAGLGPASAGVAAAAAPTTGMAPALARQHAAMAARAAAKVAKAYAAPAAPAVRSIRGGPVDPESGSDVSGSDSEAADRRERKQRRRQERAAAAAAAAATAAAMAAERAVASLEYDNPSNWEGEADPVVSLLRDKDPNELDLGIEFPKMEFRLEDLVLPGEDEEEPAGEQGRSLRRRQPAGEQLTAEQLAEGEAFVGMEALVSCGRERTLRGTITRFDARRTKLPWLMAYEDGEEEWGAVTPDRRGWRSASGVRVVRWLAEPPPPADRLGAMAAAADAVAAPLAPGAARAAAAAAAAAATGGQIENIMNAEIEVAVGRDGLTRVGTIADMDMNRPRYKWYLRYVGFAEPAYGGSGEWGCLDDEKKLWLTHGYKRPVLGVSGGVGGMISIAPPRPVAPAAAASPATAATPRKIPRPFGRTGLGLLYVLSASEPYPDGRYRLPVMALLGMKGAYGCKASAPSLAAAGRAKAKPVRTAGGESAESVLQPAAKPERVSSMAMAGVPDEYGATLVGAKITITVGRGQGHKRSGTITEYDANRPKYRWRLTFDALGEPAHGGMAEWGMLNDDQSLWLAHGYKRNITALSGVPERKPKPADQPLPQLAAAPSGSLAYGFGGGSAAGTPRKSVGFAPSPLAMAGPGGGDGMDMDEDSDGGDDGEGERQGLTPRDGSAAATSPDPDGADGGGAATTAIVKLEGGGVEGIDPELDSAMAEAASIAVAILYGGNKELAAQYDVDVSGLQIGMEALEELGQNLVGARLLVSVGRGGARRSGTITDYEPNRPRYKWRLVYDADVLPVGGGGSKDGANAAADASGAAPASPTAAEGADGAAAGGDAGDTTMTDAEAPPASAAAPATAQAAEGAAASDAAAAPAVGTSEAKAEQAAPSSNAVASGATPAVKAEAPHDPDNPSAVALAMVEAYTSGASKAGAAASDGAADGAAATIVEGEWGTLSDDRTAWLCHGYRRPILASEGVPPLPPSFFSAAAAAVAAANAASPQRKRRPGFIDEQAVASALLTLGKRARREAKAAQAAVRDARQAEVAAAGGHVVLGQQPSGMLPGADGAGAADGADGPGADGDGGGDNPAVKRVKLEPMLGLEPGTASMAFARQPFTVAAGEGAVTMIGIDGGPEPVNTGPVSPVANPEGVVGLEVEVERGDDGRQRGRVLSYDPKKPRLRWLVRYADGNQEWGTFADDLSTLRVYGTVRQITWTSRPPAVLPKSGRSRARSSAAARLSPAAPGTLGEDAGGALVSAPRPRRNSDGGDGEWGGAGAGANPGSGSSDYRYIFRRNGMCRAQITHQGCAIISPYYDTAEAAAAAADYYNYKLRGPSAHLNLGLSPEQRLVLDALSLEALQSYIKGRGDIHDLAPALLQAGGDAARTLYAQLQAHRLMQLQQHQLLEKQQREAEAAAAQQGAAAGSGGSANGDVAAPADGGAAVHPPLSTQPQAAAMASLAALVAGGAAVQPPGPAPLPPVPQLQVLPVQLQLPVLAAPPALVLPPAAPLPLQAPAPQVPFQAQPQAPQQPAPGPVLAPPAPLHTLPPVPHAHPAPPLHLPPAALDVQPAALQMQATPLEVADEGLIVEVALGDEEPEAAGCGIPVGGGADVEMRDAGADAAGLPVGALPAALHTLAHLPHDGGGAAPMEH